MDRIEIAWSLGVIGAALALAGGVVLGAVAPIVLVAGAGSLLMIYFARHLNTLLRLLGLGTIATRVCPQCGREVPTGHVACGPCGYSFVQHPAQSVPLPPGPPHTSWPESPVKLNSDDAQAPLPPTPPPSPPHGWPDPAVKLQPADRQAAAAPVSPAPPIPVPNGIQQPLLKRAMVAPPQRFCSRCGCEVKGAPKYCGDCGHKLMGQRSLKQTDPPPAK